MKVGLYRVKGIIRSGNKDFNFDEKILASNKLEAESRALSLALRNFNLQIGGWVELPEVKYEP